ncbi:MAG: efflux RND transporter periplasmic adaptor subunit [Candidatus Obscuribacterales bacterium]|jgi:multidrug resistance efflux pump|nr:efflux RND transporter periplasmic adaptor subunit [Candidatus Obscuribacterales bacterium]
MVSNLPSSPDEPTEEAPEIETSVSKHNPWPRRIIVTSVCFLAGIALGYGIFTQAPQKPENNDFTINGRIEADETHLSPGAASRVKTVKIREGDQVTKGQLLVVLDAQQLKAKIQASSEALAMAQAAEKQAKQQVQNVESEIAQAKAKGKGFFAKVFTSKSKKGKLKAELTTQMTQAQMTLHKAQAEIIKAKVMNSQLNSGLSYFNLTSPINGTCSILSVKPGELVAAGQVLVSLSDPKSVYMKGFVPEGEMSRIHLGQEAKVYLDSLPDKPLKAKLVSIDKSPSFTPENIYFKDDRVRQVFGVKLSLENSKGLAKPGMPAEAKIDFSSSSTK